MTSLDYIKKQTNDGGLRLSNKAAEKMQVYNTLDLIKFNYSSISQRCDLMKGCTIWDNDKGIKIAEIMYDKKADFNYVSSETIIHDGTFLFIHEAMLRVLCRVLNVGTYNKNIITDTIDDSFFQKRYFKYIIGDMVVASENSDRFAPDDKPWMQEMSSVMLPIRFEVVTKG